MGLCLMLWCGTVAQAQSQQQLEREKAKIEKEIARLGQQLDKAKKDSRSSTKQITLIRKRINERTRLIGTINQQMGIINREIVRNEDSLRRVRNQIDSMKSEYAKVVRTLYGMRMNITPATAIFDYRSYNYSYLKLKYFNEYSRFRKHQAALIRQQEQHYQTINNNLLYQRKEKNMLLQQENRQKEALSREQQQQQDKLDRSKQQERNLSKQIGRKEQQRQRLQQQIQQLINAEVAKNSTPANNGKSKTSAAEPNKTAVSDPLSANFAQNRGKLPWPVYYQSVSREYGIYTHASGGQNRNYGIDLNCTPGATVCAVFNGTVASVFTTPNGTKGIILRHGAYMTVYANLGTVNVSKGSTVSTRQTIGTVTNGDEHVSEFSFQVWCGKDALNPRQWLK